MINFSATYEFSWIRIFINLVHFSVRFFNIMISSISKQHNTNTRVMLNSTSIYLCQEKECLRSNAFSSKMLNKIINTDIEFKKKLYVIIVDHHGLSVICVMYNSLESHIIKLNDILLVFINYHPLHCQRGFLPSKGEQLKRSIVVMIVIQSHLV